MAHEFLQTVQGTESCKSDNNKDMSINNYSYYNR